MAIGLNLNTEFQLSKVIFIFAIQLMTESLYYFGIAFVPESLSPQKANYYEITLLPDGKRFLSGGTGYLNLWKID